jgi:hypothetical protein
MVPAMCSAGPPAFRGPCGGKDTFPRTSLKDLGDFVTPGLAAGSACQPALKSLAHQSIAGRQAGTASRRFRLQSRLTRPTSSRQAAPLRGARPLAGDGARDAPAGTPQLRQRYAGRYARGTRRGGVVGGGLPRPVWPGQPRSAGPVARKNRARLAPLRVEWSVCNLIETPSPARKEREPARAESGAATILCSLGPTSGPRDHHARKERGRDLMLR